MAVVELSLIDEERFGISTAKASVCDANEAWQAIDEAKSLGARLLIVRCPSEQLPAAQALEKCGARLMDVLVYFSRDLKDHPIPDETRDVTIRFLRSDDIARVAAIARESFKGYFGHYHADPRIDPKLADEVYVSWAERSCRSREVARQVLIAADGPNVVGFFTLRMNSADEGEAVVGGVAPESQGRGIYRSFIIRGMQWCLEEGAARMVVSTQITNIAVQKVWARLGFEPQKSYLTFHRWFDEQWYRAGVDDLRIP